MIPALDPATGHLPRGRYLCDFPEIEQRFVSDFSFTASATRAEVWRGLLDYLGAWDDTQTALSAHLPGPLVLGAWLGGSFVSGAVNPANADLTVLVSGDALRAARGHPGAGRITKLSYRDGMLQQYLVSPLVLRYEPIARVFQPERLTPDERDYLTMRGVWDDWWQRARPAGVADAEPTVDTAHPVRGYLEVVM